MKLIPAGISKTTGNSYNAFWSCPNRCPKKQNTNYVGKPNRQDQIKTAMQEKQKRIDQSIEKREESIDTWASINNATTIVAEMLKGGDVFKTTADITKKIESLAEKINEIAQKMKRAKIFKQEGELSPIKYERLSEADDAVLDMDEINGEL
jgi:heterodisulfide reductase subunit C